MSRRLKMILLGLVWLPACAAMLAGHLPARAANAEAEQAELSLWLTADTEGHVEPCSSCSPGGGRGGLAKRATFLAERRDQQPNALLLDAGNALFGGQSERSRGRVIVAAYNELGYDVMNVSYRDFRLGQQATRDALADAAFDVVSANLHDTETGEPLFEPFVVREVGERRVAVIGLSEEPRALAALPHLREQLEGVHIEAPSETLRRTLPEARAEADDVVLLYYGSASSLRETLAAVEAGEIAAVGAGGMRPNQAPTRPETPILASDEHGTSIAHLTLSADRDTQPEAAPTGGAQWHIEPTIEPNEAMNQTLESFKPEPEATGAAAVGDALPAQMEPGDRQPLLIEGENRGMGIVITEVALLEEYGELRAAPGHALLVVDVEWDNRMALELITETDRPEPILVAGVARQLFLLIDDRRVARLHPQWSNQPDTLPADFRLSHVGAMVVGKLVFEVPDPLPAKLELRYYHDQYNPLHLPLRTAADTAEATGTAGTADEDETPELPTERNDVLELSVHDVDRHDRLGDRTAPDGMTFVSLDIRGRSRVHGETEALALDPDAAPDAMAEVGRVLEYLYGIDMIQLLVDGEYAHTMDPALSTLEAEPPMLPDAFAGGRAVYLVPEDASSLELVCTFPQLKFPTLGDLGVPGTLRLPIEGDANDLERREPAMVIEDEPTPLEIIDTQLTTREDGAYLTVTMRMRNESDTGGMFGIGSRFEAEVGAARGGPVAVTLPHGVPVREPMWLPAGATRGFELTFEAEPGATTARLAYSGVSVARTVTLDLDDPIEADDDTPTPTPLAMREAPQDEQAAAEAREDAATERDAADARDGAPGDIPLNTDAQAAEDATATEQDEAPAAEDPTAQASATPDLMERPAAGEATFGEVGAEAVAAAEDADDEGEPDAADDAGVLQGDATMRVIAGDEAESWMRQHNRENVNLALHMLGAHMYSTTEIGRDDLVDFHNGRLETRQRLHPGEYRLELPGRRATEIHRIVFAVSEWPEVWNVHVEAADDAGDYTPIASISDLEHSDFHLRVLEFEPIRTDELRIVVDDPRERSRSYDRLHELMVFEGPLTDKSESVLSQGGTNIADLDHGGSVFHTPAPRRAGGMVDARNHRRYQRRYSSSDERQWLTPETLAFQANREALIEAIELRPPEDPDRHRWLPTGIRLLASTDQPFEGYETIGEYDLSEVTMPWRLELDEPVAARFLRVQFRTSADERAVNIGHLAVYEGTAPGYESVLIRGDGVEWRHREQPTLASLMGDEVQQVRTVDASTAASRDSAIEVAPNEWVGATLTEPEQRHVYRFTVDHERSAEVPELQLHMAPFLRGEVRILDEAGEVVESFNPGRQASTTIQYPLALESGEYFLELRSAPIYMFMGFDTSGSMGAARGITRDTLPELTDHLPDGVYVALGTSLRDRERGLRWTLQSPYTNDSEALRRVVLEQDMMGTGGGSDWYNFLYQMLEWADEHTPPHALGAFVLVADGVGAGDYDALWDRLHASNQRLYTVGWGSQTLRLDHLDTSTGWTAARGLFNAAWYRNGRYFEPQADEELVETYDAILDDVLTPADYAFRVRVREREPGQVATVAPEGENRPILFVLDCSGSMLMEMEGTSNRTRLDVAFDVMEQVVRNLPDHSHVGLRVYGHRFRNFGDERARAATDTELMIPIGPLDRASFIDTVRSLDARGATPLTHTIEQIPGDLRGVERPRVIILTDGVESFQRDPVAATHDLLEQYPEMAFAVVGFKIERLVDRENLRGMADAGDGTYYNATDGESLIASLDEALHPTVPYILRDWEGERAASGAFGDTHELPEGQYELEAQLDGGQSVLPLRVRRQRTARVSIEDLPEPVPSDTTEMPESPEADTRTATEAPAPEPEDAQKQREQRAQAQAEVDEADDADDAAEPATDTPRFCTQCGQRLSEGARFCTACGEPVR